MKMEKRTNNLGQFQNTTMVKDHTKDVDDWINDLRYIDKELKDLLGLQNEATTGRSHAKQLMALKNASYRQIQGLTAYKGAIDQALECDTAACDTYFQESHEAHFQEYQGHFDSFRELQLELFPKLRAGLEAHFRTIGT